MGKIIWIAMIIGSSAWASEAKFDWRQLKGKYEYVSCVGENPVWNIENIHEKYVEIWEMRANPMENYLEFFLRMKKHSPLAVNWSFHQIDQGVYEWRNPETGLIDSTQNNFTDHNSLQGYSSWDYYTGGGKYHTFGRGYMKLYFDSEGRLKYEATVQHGDKAEQHEECVLIRI